MHRRLRIAFAALALVAAALATAVAVFLAGIEVRAEFLRAPIERALTAAFKVPTRLEGPLRLRTGLTAAVSADALVLADPSAPPGATMGRGIRPVARIDLAALLRRVVTLREVTGERLELSLVRRADGRANWAPVLAPSAGGSRASVSFGGIDHLRIGTVTGSYQREGDAPVSFAITALEGSLPQHEPATVRGSAQVAGQSVAFDLRSAALADLVASATAFLVQGTAQWSGVRAEVKGELARDGSRFDAEVQASAADASVPLAALGVAAQQPGGLELRMRFGITKTEASASALALALGNSVASGSASVEWGHSHWRVVADLAGERIDLAPFAFAKSLPQEKTAPEALLELLERTATGVDAEMRLAVDELSGLPVTMKDLRLEGHSGDRVVAGEGSAVVSGTRVEARLDYDAREARRTLSVRAGGAAISTAALPGTARPRDVSGRAADIHAELRAQGESARALLGSLEANVEARDLRWTVNQGPGAPLAGRFDRVRLRVQGARASSLEVNGKLGDAACSLKISGGALAPLLDGEAWPLQVGASCLGARLEASGRLAFARRQVSGEVAFDVAADRIGPLTQALGVASALPRPIAARGTLVLEEKLATARFAALRLGRTAGSGEVAFPLGADGAGRVRLQLTSLDLNELGASADTPPPAAVHRDRDRGRTYLRLPDMDFDIAAGGVVIAGNELRRLQFGGALRAMKLPPAPFRFDWEGVAVSGRFGADFSEALPRIDLDAAAQKADLRALLARLGLADVKLRADAFTLKAQAAGRQFGELLAVATLDVALDGGRFDLGRRPPSGPSGRGEFSATLAAAPGRPTTLAVQGTIDGEPMDLSVEVSALADFARADGTAVPVTARMTIGDARLAASGKAARNGTGQGKLRISGDRLDRLGRLIGTVLPEVGPYSASGNIAVSADVARVDDLALTFGRSRLGGDLRVEYGTGRRPRYLAGLRVPVLHLEDVGAARWRDGGAPSGAGKSQVVTAGQRRGDGFEHWLQRLRAVDVVAAIDVDALHDDGERFASGHLRATAEAGVLRVDLHKVRAAGGTLEADIRVDASAETPKFGVRAQAVGLEIKPLARAVDPGSTAAGKLDLVADLTAEGRAEDLLPALTGTVDAAAYPRGLHSEILAFWGTGLLGALLGQLDPKSRSTIECAVTSVDFSGGMAKSRALFVDTASVRIVGEFEANLATRALSGRIDPVSEEPRFLTFAPTMLLGGTIDKPRLISAPENVVTVPLRLAAPLSGFALDWLVGKGKSREAAAGCGEAFERIRQARAETAGPSAR